MSFSKSSQLGNKYILLDLIGVGGMAEVYRCKLLGGKGFEKIIVLKKLLAQAAQDPEIVANFIDEARLAALLQHENIAHIYDFGEIEGSYFIAMEYLFGKDLFSFIQQAKEESSGIPAESALLIASKICDGMDYAHNYEDLGQKRLNIIHRDLTPHNVFITYEGKVKILDFGIAKAELFDNRTRAGVIKGKISYMSPEQLTKESIDHRSDIFTIGILLYEMLSSRKMYIGDTAALIRKCMHADYEKLETVQPGLPHRVYEILDKSLQIDCEKRYQSCKEMKDDIDDMLFQLNKRPKADALKEYMLSLFAQDYELEKTKLYSTTRRFDKIYAHSSEEKTRAISYKDGATSDTVIIDDRSTLTVVVESEENGSDSHMGKAGFLQAILSTLYSKSALVFFSMVILVLISDTALHENNDAVGRDKKTLQLLTASGLNDAGHNGALQVSEELQPHEFTHQKTIESLLQSAQDVLGTSENNDNETLETATKYYRQILNLSPENEVARRGLHDIGEKYAELTEKDLQDNNLLTAQESVVKGMIISPESGRLLALQNLIEQEKMRVIEQLTWKADRAMEKNAITTPADDCAYKYYREIKKFDRNSSIARQGMQTIGDRYADLAEKAYRGFDLTKAQEYVAKGLNVVPSHEHLLQIKKDLSRSPPGIFFQVIKKNFNLLVN